MRVVANVLVDGLAYGMVLFVIAAGLSVTLGLMRFVNLSHGAFAMIGGYGAVVLTRDARCSFWLAMLAASTATGVVGAVLEALVLRHLYRRGELDQVLFTLGLTFFLIATTNALAGPQVGIWLRAAVDHPEMAAALGIPIRLVQNASFAVGAALAGLGGILGAELMPLEPYYALKYLVLVLVVVSVGGMGSLLGSLVASLMLGIVETASKYVASEWGSLFFFLAMALLLAWRPNGLLRPRAAA